MRYSQFTTAEEIADDAARTLEKIAFVPAGFRDEVLAAVGRYLNRFGKDVKDLDDKELKKVEDVVDGMLKRAVLKDPFFTLNFHAGLEQTGFKIGLFSGLYMTVGLATSMAIIYLKNR